MQNILILERQQGNKERLAEETCVLMIEREHMNYPINLRPRMKKRTTKTSKDSEKAPEEKFQKRWKKLHQRADGRGIDCSETEKSYVKKNCATLREHSGNKNSNPNRFAKTRMEMHAQKK